GLCRRRLVLDYLHRMTLRRIHAEQGRTPLGNLEQKQPTPDVAILEGLVAKGPLQLVELNQLQGQRTAQKLIAVKLNRMLVQGRERLRNRETMVRGKGAHTLVDEVIHGVSLGLSHRMTNYHFPSVNQQSERLNLGQSQSLPAGEQNFHARDLNPRPTDRAVVTRWQLSLFVNDETAASRRGLAFERAHFSPDPLNGGSPDADSRRRL